MKRYKRARHFGSLVLAAVVAVLMLSVMAHATQVITTPNAAFFSYSLANGASSAPITPVEGRAILVMGTQTVLGNFGVGQVTMVRGPSGEPILEWTGLESCCPGAITTSFSSVAGTHIVYLDFSHTVDIEVHAGPTFVVHNASGIAATGNITMIW
jgi:hypothetical protein